MRGLRRSSGRRFLVAAALLVATIQIACLKESRGPVHPVSPEGTWVEVAPGETLDKLAQRTGASPEDILELNGLSRRDSIAGRKLFVPSPKMAAPAEAPPALTEAMLTDAPRPDALRWPLPAGRVVVGSPFGTRDGRPHEGIDLPAPVGTPVFAAAHGRVVYAGSGIRGYGNMVVIRHGGDLLTVYAHNSLLLVSQGQPVAAGTRIALVGQSGRATGPHLHFEVRVGQSPQDPMKFLGARP